MSVWLHNSLIELIWEIRKGGVESVNPAPPRWNPVAAASFFTCLPGRLVNLVCAVPMCALHCTEPTRAFVCICVCVYAHVCVCVCVCVFSQPLLPPPPPPVLIWLPPTCRSAGVWLIWAEVVVTSWTGVDFLSSPHTDLVFIIGSVSCLYVFIDQRCYGRR